MQNEAGMTIIRENNAGKFQVKKEVGTLDVESPVKIRYDCGVWDMGEVIGVEGNCYEIKLNNSDMTIKARR